MGAFNPLAGKGGYCAINSGAGSSSFAFDTVKPSMKNNLAEVSNFTGQGFEQWLGGLNGCKLTMSGPYDQGNMALSLGGACTITVGYSSTTNLVVTALIETIEPEVKVKDAERISVTAQSNGPFTAAVT